MKKFFAGLVMLAICGALNFGLMNDAQAAELDSTFGGLELQQQMAPPPLLPPLHPYHDDW